MKPLAGSSGPAAAWQPVHRSGWPAPPQPADLMDARTFQLVVRDRFAYNRAAPLDATSEEVDEGDWIHVTAEINAAYRDLRGRWERIPMHLYCPKDHPTVQRHQAIVYFPGRDAEWRRRMPSPAVDVGLERIAMKRIVDSGRIVVRPVYRGTYERRYAEPAADPKLSEERRICLGQDFLRVIDYLGQRSDINANELGFYGLSMGARIGAGFVALEPRVRACVLEGGGLDDSSLRQDRLVLEYRAYLPHIHVPVLMINGEADEIFPVQESQKPMFDLIGSAVKVYYIHPGGRHVLPPDVKAAKAIAWFDRYLRPPGRQL